MSIWSTTYTALSTLGYPVAANAMILAAGTDYPEEYLVYQMISNPPELHADNVETLRSYRIQVSVYSRSGLEVIPDQVETAMLAAGFTRLEGRELPYNHQTRHFGAALDYSFLED